MKPITIRKTNAMMPVVMGNHIDLMKVVDNEGVGSLINT